MFPSDRRLPLGKNKSGGLRRRHPVSQNLPTGPCILVTAVPGRWWVMPKGVSGNLHLRRRSAVTEREVGGVVRQFQRLMGWDVPVVRINC